MKDMRKVNEHREYVNDIADDCAREHSFDGLDVRAYNSCKYGFLEGYEQAEKDLGWVSVKERLPGPSEEWVVACVEVSGICTCLALATYDEETKEWHTDSWEDGEQEEYHPDYWMPIPTKVKEDEK